MSESSNQSGTDLSGKVAIVTGAGAGLGRAEALALAGAGASVVVNDLAENDAVAATLADIRALGAKAEFVGGSVAERATADALIRTADETFGGVDIVVNNAGIVRDRMLFNLSDEDWDAVLAVHLRGHFLLSRNAAAYWRGKSKESGAPIYGRRDPATAGPHPLRERRRRPIPSWRSGPAGRWRWHARRIATNRARRTASAR